MKCLRFYFPLSSCPRDSKGFLLEESNESTDVVVLNDRLLWLPDLGSSNKVARVRKGFSIEIMEGYSSNIIASEIIQ